MQESKSSSKNLIAFPRNDPSNPLNWPSWRRWLILITLTITNFNVIWNASGYTTAQSDFAHEFGTSTEVAILPLTLYITGLAFGPMTLAPLSEYYGRSPVYLATFFLESLFLMATALVPTTAGFMILRFITGFFASVSVANIGGSIADMWHSHQTGFPLSILTITSACGSSSGVFAFSFISQKCGLHAVLWAMCGINSIFFLLLCLVLRETRHSVILRRRASKARLSTRDGKLEVSEEMKTQPLFEMMKTNLSRPFVFLTTEPVIVFCAVYNGYLFGLTFLFNGAFELVFGPKGYGFNEIQVGCANLGVVVGVLLGPVTHFWQERRYLRKVEEAGGENIPEERVQLSMAAAVVFPLSLFWFAWTTYTSIHWIVPIIASAFYGWSFYTLILMTFMYIEDTYKIYAASALAGVCFARNFVGGVFPLFGTQMFENLGYQWAGSLLGFLALLLMPIPFVLEKYGYRLRKRSPWAREHMRDIDGEAVNDRDKGEV